MDVGRGWVKVCSLVVVAKAPAEGQKSATETGTDIQSGLEDGCRVAGLEDVDRNLGAPAEEAAERAEGASPLAHSSRKKTWKTKRLLRQKMGGFNRYEGVKECAWDLGPAAAKTWSCARLVADHEW